MMDDETLSAAPTSGDALRAVSPIGRLQMPTEILSRHRIVARNNKSDFADTFRLLRTRVLHNLNQLNAKTLAVTSPNQGDGKTTIAANLALAIALDVKHNVLLVDLDLRHPRLETVLGLPHGPGVTDCLIDHVPLPECLQRPNVPRLLVLGAGKPLADSSELLGSPEMAQLASELRSRYPDRIVIYDMPPLLSQDDALAFVPNVDGIVVVVRDRETPVAEVRRCLDWLEDAPILGLVLNDSRDNSFNKRMLTRFRSRRG